MTYTTGTITSTTPAKDLMAALQAPLVAGGLTFVESYAAPANQAWQCVAYGNGVFVAVNSASASAGSSLDGVTWTTRTLPSAALWNTVTFGAGLFLAVSNSAVAATSPDGIIWTQRAMPVSANWYAVAYGGGVFVATAFGSAIAATSSDGITWIQRALPVSANWRALAYGNGLFVAVTTTTIAATSSDGIVWTQRALPALSSAYTVAYSGSNFAIVSYGTAVAATSSDGATWVVRALPVSAEWLSITYGSGRFVAIASDSAISATSVDEGVTWVQQVLPVSTTWYSVAYGGGKFAVLANATSIGATSPDGVTWTQRVLAPPATSAVADVYKSPAASNTFGQDWYLILRRGTDAATQMFYQVAEGYNATTHLISNYGGRGLSTTPVAVTFANPGAAVAPDVTAAFGANANLLLVAAQQFPWRVSVTANRVVIALTNAAEIGIYAGLYEDLLPVGVTQFPLAVAIFPTQQVANSAIGNGTAVSYTGFTREPGTAVAAATNFVAQIHNGYWQGAAAVIAADFTPRPTTSALYGNAGGISRVMLGSARSVAQLPDALRGLLLGCVSSSYVSVAGDTLTVDGKTYVRFAGPTTSYGIFVDQSL